jgi:hypothetical protein
LAGGFSGGFSAGFSGDFSVGFSGSTAAVGADAASVVSVIGLS